MSQMQNEKLKARLNTLVDKAFLLDGDRYFCISWQDNEHAHSIVIATNNGIFPAIEYKDLAAFLDKIQIVPDEEDSTGEKGVVKAGEPFLPPMLNDLLTRQNEEATTMGGILLKMAEELGKGTPVTANAIERAKHIAQLSQSLTNQHKAQTNGIAEVGRLFRIKSKGQGKHGDSETDKESKPPE
jgi:hypothetical protein